MRFWKWLAGHWVDAVGIFLGVSVVAFSFLGRLTPDLAVCLFMGIVTMVFAQQRQFLTAHRAEMVQLLTEVAAAGRAAETHNVAAAVQVGELAVEDGAKLAEEAKAQKS